MNKYNERQMISDKKYQKIWSTIPCSSLYVAHPRNWANLVLNLLSNVKKEGKDKLCHARQMVGVFWGCGDGGVQSSEIDVSGLYRNYTHLCFPSPKRSKAPGTNPQNGKHTFQCNPLKDWRNLRPEGLNINKYPILRQRDWNTLLQKQNLRSLRLSA